MPDDDRRAYTPSERRNNRRYALEMAAGGTAYAVLCLISFRSVDALHGILKVAMALLPMIGVAGMNYALIRFALRLDECQRQTIIISGAIAALVCATLSLLFVFLQNAGAPPIPMTAIWPITVVAWAIALPIVRYRFR